MPELLLELFSEEIPARMQLAAADDLKRLVTKGLSAAGLEHDRADAFVTPRRLALVVNDLPARQPDTREERRGPKADAPEKAVEGFLNSIGMSRDQVEERETPKGTFLFAVVERKGRATAEVLKDVIEAALGEFPWPKSMRWADGETRWVRPLHRILCVFDGAVVPVEYAGVTADNLSQGHRFLGREPFEVRDFADYRDKLRLHHVVLDHYDRQRMIGEQAAALAATAGLNLNEDGALVVENAGLTEWPVCMLGAIDSAFMDVPAEALISAMGNHQKYFALSDDAGNMAPHFVLTANIDAADGGMGIVAGNERVLRARLADAKFFWDQDRKTKLAERVPRLRQIVFHKKLGTVADKVERVMALALKLEGYVPGATAEENDVARAAQLCKADLTAGMVGEFPELQGTMGRYYALNDGENERVAAAIEEHYKPLGPNDECPTAPVSVAVALADKLDTLVGFWAIDEKPTGSKDPYALRRAALGVIRLVLENDLRLPLRKAFEAAADVHGVASVADDLMGFFAERLKVHLRERGVRHDLITAVFAQEGEDDLVRLFARADALQDFLNSEDGANLLTAYGRAANIVRAEEKKDGTAYVGAVDEAKFAQEEEARLHTRITEAQRDAESALADEDYVAAMAALAGLRDPVDEFFDAVTVNADEPELRVNRLNLLAEIRATLDRVADFSQIEG